MKAGAAIVDFLAGAHLYGRHRGRRCCAASRPARRWPPNMRCWMRSILRSPPASAWHSGHRVPIDCDFAARRADNPSFFAASALWKKAKHVARDRRRPAPRQCALAGRRHRSAHCKERSTAPAVAMSWANSSFRRNTLIAAAALPRLMLGERAVSNVALSEQRSCRSANSVQNQSYARSMCSLCKIF